MPQMSPLLWLFLIPVSIYVFLLLLIGFGFFQTTFMNVKILLSSKKFKW